MTTRKPWLRRFLIAGAIGGAGILLLLIVCLAILSRQPLTENLIEEPVSAFKSNSGQSTGAENHYQIDPVNPPESHEAYVAAIFSRSPTEGARLYLDLLRDFKAGNYYEDRMRLSGNHFGALRLEDEFPAAYAAWLAEQNSFIERINAMIAAGGPPLVTADELVAMHKEILENQEENQFNLFARNVLFEKVVLQVNSRNLEGAAFAATDLLNFMAVMQNNPSFVGGGAINSYARILFETLGSLMEDSKLSAPSASLLLEAVSKLRPFSEIHAESIDLTLRLRRKEYVQAINGSPIDSVDQVSKMRIMVLAWELKDLPGNEHYIVHQTRLRYHATKFQAVTLWNALKIKVYGEQTLNAFDAQREAVIRQYLEGASGDLVSAPTQPSKYLLNGEPTFTDYSDRIEFMRSHWLWLAVFRAALQELSGAPTEPSTIDPYSPAPILRREDGDFVEFRSLGLNGIHDADGADSNDDITLRIRIKPAVE